MAIEILSQDEIDEVSGAVPVKIYSASMFFVGMLGMIVGEALTVAGMGTPISIGGAALAAEGTAAVAVGLLAP